MPKLPMTYELKNKCKARVPETLNTGTKVFHISSKPGYGYESRVLMTKNGKNTAEFFSLFLIKNCKKQKASSTTKNGIHQLFLFLFLPSWIKIRTTNPGTDSRTPLKPDPTQIRIHNTVWNHYVG
jgi:hypothetical protein